MLYVALMLIFVDKKIIRFFQEQRLKMNVLTTVAIVFVILFEGSDAGREEIILKILKEQNDKIGLLFEVILLHESM